MALQSPYFNHRRESSVDAASLRRCVPGAGTLGRQAHGGAITLPTLQESESRLIVGPNIRLKSVEITDCDTLLVDGTVEATMDLRVMQINERGAYTGTAEVDTAEIRGQFEGVLLVRETLVIHSTGRVSGRIRYGRIVIEEGGQLAGDVERGTEQAVPVPGSAPVLGQAVAAG